MDVFLESVKSLKHRLCGDGSGSNLNVFLNGARKPLKNSDTLGLLGDVDCFIQLTVAARGLFGGGGPDYDSDNDVILTPSSQSSVPKTKRKPPKPSTDHAIDQSESGSDNDVTMTCASSSSSSSYRPAVSTVDCDGAVLASSTHRNISFSRSPEAASAVELPSANSESTRTPPSAVDVECPESPSRTLTSKKRRIAVCAQQSRVSSSSSSSSSSSHSTTGTSPTGCSTRPPQKAPRLTHQSSISSSSFVSDANSCDPILAAGTVTVGSSKKSYRMLLDVAATSTFVDIFHQLTSEEYLPGADSNNIHLKAFFASHDGGREGASVKFEVSNLNHTLAIVRRLYSSANFVHFTAHVTGTRKSIENPAFKNMMATAKKDAGLHWPDFDSLATKNNADVRVRRDFVEYLKEQNMGFTKEQTVRVNPRVRCPAENFVCSVADAMFYLVPHEATLNKRALYLPHELKLQAPYHTAFTKKTRLTVEKLQKIEADLSEYAIVTWFDAARWKPMKRIVLQLLKTVAGYISYLGGKSITVKESQKREDPNKGDPKCRKLSVEAYPAGLTYSKIMHEIEKLLSARELYDPLDLADLLSRFDRRARYRIANAMSFPFATYMLAIDRVGAQKPALMFVWRGREDEHHLSRTVKLTSKLHASAPEYHSREQRREFKRKMNVIANITPSAVSYMYKELTGDQSVEGLSAEMKGRIKFAMEVDDPEFILDYRELNGRSEDEEFKVFWQECHNYLDNFVVAQERRHGLVGYFPVAASVNAFIDIIKQRVRPGTKIPSETTVRRQFMPVYQNRATAAKYTGRFPVIPKVQTRSIRMKHIDSAYGYNYQMLHRDYAVQVRLIIEPEGLLSVHFSCDDKRLIYIGPPGVPVSTGERRRGRSLVPFGQTLSAADHDTLLRGRGCPSLILSCDVPTLFGMSMYSGRVFINLHDAVFRPSTALSHASDTAFVAAKLVRESGKQLAVMTYVSDGGGDHQIRHQSVQIVTIALFLYMDLDIMHKVQTVANHSYANIVERVMSILNLALQNISLCRPAMTEELENMYMRCKSLADVRRVGKDHPEFRKAWLDVHEQLLEIVREMFSHLNLKGKPFETFTVAQERELLIFKEIKRVDPNFDMSKKKIEHTKVTRAWQNAHSPGVRHYGVGLAKLCKLNGECKWGTCKPLKMSKNAFVTLTRHAFVPDPVPKDDGSQEYKSFEELFGTKTTERFRPSADTRNRKEKLPTTWKSKEKVRGFVKCASCGKPRCVFAWSLVSAEGRKLLEECADTMNFHCGAFEIAPDEERFNLLKVKLQDDPRTQEPFPAKGLYTDRRLLCDDPVEKVYYSSPLYAFEKPVCYRCGDPLNEAQVTAAEQEGQSRGGKTVFPLCFKTACTKAGYYGSIKKLNHRRVDLEKKREQRRKQEDAREERKHKKGTKCAAKFTDVVV